MKNKLVFTLFAVLLLNIFPLLLQPELIFHYKTIILCLSAAILWLSQPAFRKDEVQEDKKTDKQSILMILVASSASVFISVTEWAYFAGNHDEMNLKTMVGLVLLITGIVIRVWSIRILGRNFTATVKVTEKPWTIIDDRGLVSNSLMPAPVALSLIKQMSDVLGL